jgi:hypothetical protein
MKKVVLALGATLMAFGLSAQVHPSNNDGKPWWVSGAMMFQNGKNTLGGNDNSKTNTLGFMPSVGYMLTEDIGAGLTLNLSQTKSTFYSPIDGSEANEQTINQTNIGLFGRYYAYHVEDFAFFGQLDVAFGFGKVTNEDFVANTTSEDKLSSFGVGISPGIQYWFSPAWSLTAQVGLLGFGSQTTTDANDNEDKTTVIEASLFPGNANFALNFHF